MYCRLIMTLNRQNMYHIIKENIVCIIKVVLFTKIVSVVFCMKQSDISSLKIRGLFSRKSV